MKWKRTAVLDNNALSDSEDGRKEKERDGKSPSRVDVLYYYTSDRHPFTLSLSLSYKKGALKVSNSIW